MHYSSKQISSIMKTDKKILKSASMVAGALLTTTLATTPAIGADILAYNDLGTGSQVRSHLIEMNANQAEGQTSSVVKFAELKCGEGKCGEGKCGEGDKKEAKTDAKKSEKAKATAKESKSAEAKCGEGKCGEGEKKADAKKKKKSDK
jgi:uncharacterized low-complexity protein